MQQPPTSPNYWQHVTLLVNIVSALGVSAAAWAAWASTRITNRVFEAAYRPYIGVPSITNSADINAGTLGVNPLIKNYGSVPAQIMSVEWKYTLNGEELPQQHIQKNLPSLFPETHTNLATKLANTNAIKLAREGAKLELALTIRYKGAGKKMYEHTQVATYVSTGSMRLDSTREVEE